MEETNEELRKIRNKTAKNELKEINDDEKRGQ